MKAVGEGRLAVVQTAYVKWVGTRNFDDLLIAPGLTGIDDPYEPPEQADIVLDTVKHSAEDNARLIQDYLSEQGFVRGDDWGRAKSDDGRGDEERTRQQEAERSLD